MWYKPTTALAGDKIQIAYGMVWMGAGWATPQLCHATERWAVLWAMELYCVQLGFLLGDDATIWYSIVWHRTVWYGEEEFGFVLDDNGFGGWHNWVGGWHNGTGGNARRGQRVIGATNYLSSPSLVPNSTKYFLVPTICHPSPQYLLILFGTVCCLLLLLLRKSLDL